MKQVKKVGCVVIFSGISVIPKGQKVFLNTFPLTQQEASKVQNNVQNVSHFKFFNQKHSLQLFMSR